MTWEAVNVSEGSGVSDPLSSPRGTIGRGLLTFDQLLRCPECDCRVFEINGGLVDHPVVECHACRTELGSVSAIIAQIEQRVREIKANRHKRSLR